MKKWLRKIRNDQRGIGIVEIILILVVLIALVVLFRDQIYGLVNNLFGNINRDSQSIINVSPTVGVTK